MLQQTAFLAESHPTSPIVLLVDDPLPYCLSKQWTSLGYIIAVCCRSTTQCSVQYITEAAVAAASSRLWLHESLASHPLAYLARKTLVIKFTQSGFGENLPSLGVFTTTRFNILLRNLISRNCWRIAYGYVSLDLYLSFSWMIPRVTISQCFDFGSYLSNRN